MSVLLIFYRFPSNPVRSNNNFEKNRLMWRWNRYLWAENKRHFLEYKYFLNLLNLQDQNKSVLTEPGVNGALCLK